MLRITAAWIPMCDCFTAGDQNTPMADGTCSLREAQPGNRSAPLSDPMCLFAD